MYLNTSVNIIYVVHSIYYNRHSKYYILVLLFYVLGVVTLEKSAKIVHPWDSMRLSHYCALFLTMLNMLKKVLLGSFLWSMDGGWCLIIDILHINIHTYI